MEDGMNVLVSCKNKIITVDILKKSNINETLATIIKNKDTIVVKGRSKLAKSEKDLE